MPLPVNSQYPPPQSWEEFESLCADLYGRIWNDPNTQKHGRQGQPQGGVDVYGQPDGKNYSGVQCKKKDIWPPTVLTITEIDEEVEKAKTWQPSLKHYIIATTAPNDDKVQAHARVLTKTHKKTKCFSVSVASWDEITRHLATYPELLRKYGYLSDVTEVVGQAKTAIAVETANLVVEKLRRAPQKQNTQSATPDPSVVGALERDLAARFTLAMRRTFFPETSKVDEYVNIADIASEQQYAGVSPALRRRIFLTASRSAAVRGTVEKAEELLRMAQMLEGPDSDLLARARILEKRGDIDGALALVRDETDADSRSTVFNIIFRHRGRDAALKWLSDEKLAVPDLTISGVQTLAAIHLQNQDFEGLRLRLQELASGQLDEAPYFRFLRATVNVACLLPVPDRGLAVHSFLTDARNGTRSILDDATTAARLDLALDDLTTLLPIASELELRQAKRLAETYVRWCELLHPYRKEAGLEHLRDDVKDPKSARGRVSLALRSTRNSIQSRWRNTSGDANSWAASMMTICMPLW